MPSPTKLYRTTIVVWSEHPDFNGLEQIAEQDASGEFYYVFPSNCEEVTDIAQFPDTEFFDQ